MPASRAALRWHNYMQRCRHPASTHDLYGHINIAFVPTAQVERSWKIWLQDIRIPADCTSAEQQADELRGKYLFKYVLISYGCTRAARRSRLQSAQQASLPEIC